MEIQYLEPEINRLLASMIDIPSVYEAYYKLHSIMEYRREGTTPTNLGAYENNAEGSLDLSYKIAEKYFEIVVPVLYGELLEIYKLMVSCVSFQHAEDVLLKQIAVLMVAYAKKGGRQNNISILAHCMHSYYYLNPNVPEEIATESPQCDISNIIFEILYGMHRYTLKELNFNFFSWKDL